MARSFAPKFNPKHPFVKKETSTDRESCYAVNVPEKVASAKGAHQDSRTIIHCWRHDLRLGEYR